MKATVTLHDGEILTAEQDRVAYSKNQPVSLAVVGDEVLLHADGRPDAFGTTAWQPQPAKYNDAVADDAPNLPLGAPLNGARQAIGNKITLVDHGDYRPPHPNPTYQSDQFHVLEGGDTAFWKFGLDPLPDEEARKKALELLDLRYDILAHPKMQEILSLQTVRATSGTPSTKLRDLGWIITPECIHTRHGSVGIETLQGWYHFGDINANTDGHTNGHYDSPLYPFVKYLLDGDTNAFHLGMYLLRQKLAYGLIQSNGPRGSHWTKGWYRQEKGQQRRGHGGPKWPNCAKEWDGAFYLADLLTWPNGGELMRRARIYRDDCLLNRDVKLVWNGANGGRALGHGLDSLWYAYKRTGDDRFRDVAAAVIDHAFFRVKQLGDPPYFPNTNLPTQISAAEETFAHAAIHRWQKNGVGVDHTIKLATMIEWAIEHGGVWMPDGTFRVAYQTSVPAGIPQVNVARQGCMWTRLWRAAEDHLGTRYKKHEIECMKGIWNEIPAGLVYDFGGWWSSTPKWIHIICGMVLG